MDKIPICECTRAIRDRLHPLWCTLPIWEEGKLTREARESTLAERFSKKNEKYFAKKAERPGTSEAEAKRRWYLTTGIGGLEEFFAKTRYARRSTYLTEDQAQAEADEAGDWAAWTGR